MWPRNFQHVLNVQGAIVAGPTALHYIIKACFLKENSIMML